MKYKNIYLITDELREIKEVEDIVLKLKTDYTITPTIQKYTKIVEDISPSTLYLLFLTDEDIKVFFQNNINKDINIAIISNDFCQNAIKNYGISKDMFEAIEDGLNSELLSKIDLLKCNEILAFNKITIGDMHGMNNFNTEKQSYLKQLKTFTTHIKNLKFKIYTITTSKEHKIQTAASGITILEHTNRNEKSALSDELSIHDGKLNVFVLAPTSLFSYLWYLISIFFYQKLSIIELPRSLGFIKSSKVSISSDTPIDFTVDENLVSSKEVIIEVIQDGINLHLGRNLASYVKNDTNKIEEKDTVKLNTLPKGEVNNILIGGKLPLFKKANDDDFKELFVSLRASAKFSYVFLTLMILSTLLATTGLFANSAPVIIGAMILAPLMSPIVSLSMGVIRADKFLLEQSIRTLSIGIFMALLFSCIFTIFIPLQQITPEMQSRLNPNLLDLMIAIFSGIAGAYANSKEDISKSLAGVAIAVALVPPLSVTGIGIGLGNFEVIYGSFLLFITNLVGITLSAALTFIVLGYSPVKRAKKGIFYTTIMMIFITIPLVFSFAQMIEKNNYINQLKPLKYISLLENNVELNIQDIQINNNITISIEVITNKTLNQNDFKMIKNKIEENLHQKVILNINTKIIVK